MTKVEITGGLGPLDSAKVVIDGVQMKNVNVTVSQRLGEGPPEVYIDGGRPLYETEVWINGVLTAKVPGLLAAFR